MIRVFSSTCLALVLLFAHAAHAGKPLIAVLGLEVIDPGGTPTPQDTQVAKALTEGLRSRAKAGTGAYQIAGNSDKELIDEKLLKNCDSEAPTCMASIGNDLGADVLMYGRIEKKGTAYTVSMRLLDVHRKIVEKSCCSQQDSIPLSQASNEADLQRWAKTIYGKLTGQSTTGQILVRTTNADRGTILVNGEEKGNINNGIGQINGLDEGKYRLEVQSEGFKPWSDTVAVRAGETSNVAAKLEKVGGGGGVVEPPPDGGGIGPGGMPEGPGPEGSRGNSGWKAVFVASAVVAAVGGGVAIWQYGVQQDARNALCQGGAYHPEPTADNPNPPIVDKSCPTPTQVKMKNGTVLDGTAYQKQIDKGDAAHRNMWIGDGVAIGAGAFALVALYKGFIAKNGGSSGEHAAVGHRVHRERFVVTPIVSPDGGGATLRFDW